MTLKSKDMIQLGDKVDIKIEVATLSTLIAGIYCTVTQIDPIAIPTSIYIELAEKLVPYLENWDYDKISFEQWIETHLLIIPKAMCSEEDIEEFKQNTVYLERENGNAILIVTFEV